MTSKSYYEIVCSMSRARGIVGAFPLHTLVLDDPFFRVTNTQRDLLHFLSNISIIKKIMWWYASEVVKLLRRFLFRHLESPLTKFHSYLFLFQIEARSVGHLQKLNSGLENKIIELQMKLDTVVSLLICFSPFGWIYACPSLFRISPSIPPLPRDSSVLFDIPFFVCCPFPLHICFLPFLSFCSQSKSGQLANVQIRAWFCKLSILLPAIDWRDFRASPVNLPLSSQTLVLHPASPFCCCCQPRSFPSLILLSPFRPAPHSFLFPCLLSFRSQIDLSPPCLSALCLIAPLQVAERKKLLEIVGQVEMLRAELGNYEKDKWEPFYFIVKRVSDSHVKRTDRNSHILTKLFKLDGFSMTLIMIIKSKIVE